MDNRRNNHNKRQKEIEEWRQIISDLTHVNKQLQNDLAIAESDFLEREAQAEHDRLMREIKREAEELKCANDVLRQSIGQFHKRTKDLNDQLQQESSSSRGITMPQTSSAEGLNAPSISQVDLSSGASGSSNDTPSMFGNEQNCNSGGESDDNADGANSPPMQGKIVVTQTPQHIECNDVVGSIAKTSTINIGQHIDSSENEHVQNYDRPKLLTTGEPVVIPPTQQDDALQTDAITPLTTQEEGHFDEFDKRSEVNTSILEKQQEIQETSTNDNADAANSPPTQEKIVIPETPQNIEYNDITGTNAETPTIEIDRQMNSPEHEHETPTPQDDTLQTDANTSSTAQEEGHFYGVENGGEVNKSISEKQQEMREMSRKAKISGKISEQQYHTLTTNISSIQTILATGNNDEDSQAKLKTAVANVVSSAHGIYTSGKDAESTFLASSNVAHEVIGLRGQMETTDTTPKGKVMKLLRCKTCKIFTARSALIMAQHVNSSHSGQQQNNVSKEMKETPTVMDQNQNNKFMCKVCKAECGNAKSLLLHEPNCVAVRDEENDCIEFKWKCQKCGHILSKKSKKAIRTHRNKCTGVNPLKRKHENDDSEELSDSETSSVDTQASLISMASNTNESAQEKIEHSGNINLPPDIELNPMEENETEVVSEMLATFDCSNMRQLSAELDKYLHEDKSIESREMVNSKSKRRKETPQSSSESDMEGVQQTSQGEADGSCANDSSNNEQDEQVLHRNRKQIEESQKEIKTRKADEKQPTQQTAENTESHSGNEQANRVTNRISDNTSDMLCLTQRDGTRLIHNENLPATTCRICEAKFPDTKAKTLHIEQCKKKYMCEVCYIPIAHIHKGALVSIRNHLLLCNGKGIYKCPTCDSCKSTNESAVKQHWQRVCKGPNKCTQCNTRFSELNSLKDHLEKKHPLLRCEVCNTVFQMQTQLTRHMTSVHQSI